MHGASNRTERLADQIRAEIAALIAEDLRDPRIGFATVMRVELSADRQHARVYVGVLGDESKQQATMAGLSSAAGYVRTEITHRLRLRRAPEVVFTLDHGPEESLRLEKIIEGLHKGNS